MEDWEFGDLWEGQDEEDYVQPLLWLTQALADRFFLSDNGYLPSDGEDYVLGHLNAEDWWPLANQLDEMVELEIILDLVDGLDTLLGLPGIPTELLEEPASFLLSVLEGNLPPELSGRRVGSRKLVKIAQMIVQLLQEFPEAAQAAVRAWADVYRGVMGPFAWDEYERDELAELLSTTELPMAMTGFSMMIALTMMRWPGRAERLPLPRGIADPESFDHVLVQWESLPDTPTVAEEGAGEAEALFAQGQLAHTLAQMGTVELMAAEGMGDEDIALIYSRLSRSILWIHHQCRHCPERDGVSCRVAINWPERPVPLLDIASEIANTGWIAGCIKAE